jgi:hypothetical protein
MTAMISTLRDRPAVAVINPHVRGACVRVRPTSPSTSVSDFPVPALVEVRPPARATGIALAGHHPGLCRLSSSSERHGPGSIETNEENADG